MSNVMPFPHQDFDDCPPGTMPPQAPPWERGWGFQNWQHGHHGWQHPPGCCGNPSCWCCRPCPPPLVCVPGTIVPSPPRPISGPIIGVTDGSDAAPGMVGEFLQFEADINFPAYPGILETNASVCVLQPGDWDIWVTAGPQSTIGDLDVFLDPKPLGCSNESRGVLFITVTGQICSIQDTVIVCQPNRGSFAVPTLMAFHAHVDNSRDSTIVAGTIRLVLTARRAR